MEISLQRGLEPFQQEARRANQRTASEANSLVSRDAVQRSPGDANGSRECAPDDRLRVVRLRCSADPESTGQVFGPDR